MQNIINRSRIRQIRFDRGIAARQLANLAGMDIAVINGLETDERHNTSTISVAQLQRVADVLHVPIGHLFYDADEPADPSQPSPNAAFLGAVLITLGKTTRTKAIAQSLDWTMVEVADAAKELIEHLKPAGLTVLRGRGNLQIVPLDDAHQSATIKIRQHRLATTTQKVVTRYRAKLLFKMEREAQSPHPLTEADRIHVAVLIRTGMVTEDEHRNLIVADEVLHSIYPEGFQRVAASTAKSDAAQARVIRERAEKLALAEQE